MNKLIIVSLLLFLFGCEKSEQIQNLKHSWILTEWKYVNSDTNYLDKIELSTNPCDSTNYNCLQYKLSFIDSNSYQIIYDFGQSKRTEIGFYYQNEESLYFLCGGHLPCMIWTNYSRQLNYLLTETESYYDTIKTNQLFIRD